jgi:hypothetical protein
VGIEQLLAVATCPVSPAEFHNPEVPHPTNIDAGFRSFYMSQLFSRVRVSHWPPTGRTIFRTAVPLIGPAGSLAHGATRPFLGWPAAVEATGGVDAGRSSDAYAPTSAVAAEQLAVQPSSPPSPREIPRSARWTAWRSS